MGRKEDPGESGLEHWIAIIGQTWNQIPEYKVNPEKIRHLAVICDGNRRFARKNGLKDWEGHRLGVEVIKGTVRACKKWDIRYLTLWTWSTENWKRDKAQVDFVMDLAAKYLKDEEVRKVFVENGANFRHIGRVDRLPDIVREGIIELQDITSSFRDYSVNLALDYGGQDEIARAVGRIIDEDVSPEDISGNPDILYKYLDTAGQPLPDLVVRTGQDGGEVPHTSGFMPLQTTYSGWQFVPDLFPALTPQALLADIQDFEGYDRRVGR